MSNVQEAARALLAKAYAVDSTTEVELLADEFSALELALDQPAPQAPQPKGSAPTKQFEDWWSAHGNAATDNVEELCGRAWEAALSASQLSVQAAGPSVDPSPALREQT